MNSRIISLLASSLIVSALIFSSVLKNNSKRYSVNIAIEANHLDTLIIVWGFPTEKTVQFNQFSQTEKKQIVEEEVMLINFAQDSNFACFKNKKTMHLNEVHCSVYTEDGLFSEVTKKSLNFFDKTQTLEWKSKKLHITAFEVESTAPLTISVISNNKKLQSRVLKHLNELSSF